MCYKLQSEQQRSPSALWITCRFTHQEAPTANRALLYCTSFFAVPVRVPTPTLIIIAPPSHSPTLGKTSRPLFLLPRPRSLPAHRAQARRRRQPRRPAEEKRRRCGQFVLIEEIDGRRATANCCCGEESKCSAARRFKQDSKK